ncbi:MAG: ATP-dependent DNA helicase [Candidatus Nanoarchaeia archaeon]|nr:ATP-dependent DNA helicase [Candidatus Nanoarchaeia archaeon]
MSRVLFPHDKMRPIQEGMVELISDLVHKKKHGIIHAPTGLGKTAASIAPTLYKALDEHKTIFFLTSRNTQHKIALDTVKQIKEKFNIPIQATDFIGKKWMCIQPGVQLLKTNEFGEYCKALREDGQCPYFEGMKTGEKLSANAKIAIDELSNLSPVYIEQTMEVGNKYKLCPYELAQNLAKSSQIIITDYYYMFHPSIRNKFLKKINKKLENSIIIVDEAHNLHDRIKDLASVQVSTIILSRALKEAKKYKLTDIEETISNIASILRLLLGTEQEKYIEKEKFVKLLSSITNYHEFTEGCYRHAEIIREDQKQSYIGALAYFLDSWIGTDEGFTRIISRKKGIKEDTFTLSYRCLDPSIIAKEVLTESNTVILMSGTLTPTDMYSKLLGFDESKTEQIEFPSPFPHKNRLNLIIAKTSTKYTTRSDAQFQEIAKTLVQVINATPGNSAIFFPSYFLRDQIYEFMSGVEKTIFKEEAEMNRDEKEEVIKKFKGYKKTGATLLAVIGGSFGEGIDLPGDELKTVVIVGLPLTKPDLETDALIKYYDEKFGKGWDYGYVFPAFNKVIQSAGRCIRSETDKGVIIFLDERYAWKNYSRCFPQSWQMEISVDNYEQKIKEFFKNNK